MVFLELKFTSILLRPNSHPADIYVESRKPEVGSPKSEVPSRLSLVGAGSLNGDQEKKACRLALDVESKLFA